MNKKKNKLMVQQTHFKVEIIYKYLNSLLNAPQSNWIQYVFNPVDKGQDLETSSCSLTKAIPVIKHLKAAFAEATTSSKPKRNEGENIKCEILMPVLNNEDGNAHFNASKFGKNKRACVSVTLGQVCL